MGHDVRWTSYAKALTATVMWGFSFIALLIALETTGPFGVVWLRNALAALLLFALLWFYMAISPASGPMPPSPNCSGQAICRRLPLPRPRLRCSPRPAPSRWPSHSAVCL